MTTLSFYRAEADYKLACSRANQDYQRERQNIDDAHRLSLERAGEDFANKVQDNVSDILNSARNSYRVYDAEWNKLQEIILQQLKRLLYIKKEYDHAAIKGLKDGNMDWFAAPYFQGESIQLSDVFNAYNSYTPGMRVHMRARRLMYFEDSRIEDSRIAETEDAAHEIGESVHGDGVLAQDDTEHGSQCDGEHRSKRARSYS